MYKIILWKSKKQGKAKVEIHMFKELSCDGVFTEIVLLSIRKVIVWKIIKANCQWNFDEMFYCCFFSTRENFILTLWVSCTPGNTNKNCLRNLSLCFLIWIVNIIYEYLFSAKQTGQSLSVMFFIPFSFIDNKTEPKLVFDQWHRDCMWWQYNSNADITLFL